jgi:hypothetical protein
MRKLTGVGREGCVHEKFGLVATSGALLLVRRVHALLQGRHRLRLVDPLAVLNKETDVKQ